MRDRGRTQKRCKPRNRSDKVLYPNMRNSSAKTDEPEYLAAKEGFDKRGTSRVWQSDKNQCDAIQEGQNRSQPPRALL